ncbi:MAG: 30S ribosomal protein S20 [Planctomycetes bacterium]|nr:30S ribosomal protein S20 [Planctomycetota bacterium]MBI3843118.1 30S ribosomal protein S20 [Planctomycetota bacterium]
MATSRSAKKRVRQNETRRQKNRAVSSRFKTAIKRFEDAIESKNAAQAKTQLAEVSSLLDKAARGNVIHRNKAAREKSHLQRAMNRLAPAAK